MRGAVTGCAFTSYAVVDSGAARVALDGELDWDTAPCVRNVVEACLAEEPTSLHLDLTNVSFCDCAGLGVLLGVRSSVLAARVDLVVEGIGAQLARLLDLTGADGVLTEGKIRAVAESAGCVSGAVTTPDAGATASGGPPARGLLE